VFDACFRHGVVARLEWPAGVYDDGWAQRLQLCGKSLPCIEDGSFSQTRGQCPGQNSCLVGVTSRYDHRNVVAGQQVRNALSKIAVAAEDQNFAH
jgi:hypothetical protein